MDIASLREFLLVSDKGSYQAAAAELGISPSSLTRHIQSLENEVGELLLLRSTHSLELTDAGNILRRYAWSIINSENSMYQDFQRLKDDAHRNLSIGIPLHHDEDAFEKFLIAFCKANPDIGIDYSEYPARKLFQYLDQNDLDIVFAHEFESDDPGLEYVPFTNDQMFIHITEKDPMFQLPEISLSMLKDRQIYMRYNMQGSFARHIREIFSSLNISAELLDLQGCWPQNIPATLFITTGTKIRSIKHSGKVRILPLKPAITFTYGLYFPSNANLSGDFLTFLEFCKDWSLRNNLLGQKE